LVAALLMLLVAASASDASGRGKSVPECSPLRPHVLVANAQAQVYQVPGAAVRGCEIPGSAKIFGRILGHRRAYVLGAAPWGTPEVIGGVFDETLAGPVVAYKRSHEEFEPRAESDVVLDSNLVVVRNLRTGRVLHSVPTGTPVTPEEGRWASAEP